MGVEIPLVPLSNASASTPASLIVALNTGRRNTFEVDIDIKLFSAAEDVMHLSVTLQPQAGD